MLRSMYFEVSMYIISYTLLMILMIIISKIIKKKKIASAIIVIMCIIYASIRYNVGSDYDTYYLQYNNSLDYFYSVKQILSLDFQFSFNIILFLTKYYLQNEYAIFFVTSLIIYPLTFRAIRKTSNSFSESVVLYFLLGFHLISLNILKQEIAMIIFLFIYNYIIKDEKKKWLLIILLSYLMLTFHISGLIPLIILFISCLFKPTKFKIAISTLLSTILLFSYKNIVNLIPFLSRYVRYTTDINKDYYIVIIGTIGYLIFNLILLFIIYKNKEDLINKNKNNRIIINALILSIPLKVVGIFNFPIYRLSLYIDQLLLFIVPDLINIFKEKNKQRFSKEYIMYFIILIIYNAFSIIFLAHNNFYTYQTIFNR